MALYTRRGKLAGFTNAFTNRRANWTWVWRLERSPRHVQQMCARCTRVLPRLSPPILRMLKHWRSAVGRGVRIQHVHTREVWQQRPTALPTVGPSSTIITERNVQVLHQYLGWLRTRCERSSTYIRTLIFHSCAACAVILGTLPHCVKYTRLDSAIDPINLSTEGRDQTKPCEWEQLCICMHTRRRDLDFEYVSAEWQELTQTSIWDF